jgi:hypothetical protein
MNRQGQVKFIEAMPARLVNELPEGKDWLYEVKFDGYRCLVVKSVPAAQPQALALCSP